MSVYYKFKSAKDYDSISIDGHFISVGSLKEKIFESKHLGKGTDFDLVVTNAQTNEDYSDENTLIPKNTAVLIRRVPGRPRLPIVATTVTEEELRLENKAENVQTVKSSFVGVDSSAMKYAEDTEWDEFGNDLYSIPEVLPVQSSNPVQDAAPSSKADEDNKIKALIDTPALDWQRQPADGFGPGRGFVRNGRMINNRNFGRGGFELKTPPPGYVCHRCKVPGHFIQHCPTNGDPNFDIKRVKPPTGIPKSMLMATPDGSYALPSGAAAVLRPNEAAFEKEIEGLPSTRSVGDLPPELRCPLCKEVMKDAVLTSKCCFKSFCDKCIRDYIISKSVCVCGATNILADDLLPNKTLRDTINRILESNTDSAENGGSAYQVQDMESRNPQAKIPSPTQSAASKGWQEQPPIPHREETSKLQKSAEEGKAADAPIQATEKQITAQVANAPEAMHESMSVKEPASEGSAPLVDEEVQQKPASGEAGKKKKKKRARLPLNAADMQWRMPQDLAAENYMMSMGPSAYNPYWGMQPGMEGFVAPFPGAMPYNMGYGVGPMDLPFGGVLPQDPFGGQGCMLPFGPPPPRDIVNFGMGFNAVPPPMSREEFEARKADLKRRRELERRAGESRDLPKDREFGREVSSSGDVSSVKPKSRPSPIPPSLSSDRQHHHRHHSERPSPDRRSRDPELPRPSLKKKSEYDDYHHRQDHHDDYRRSDHHDDRRKGYDDNRRHHDDRRRGYEDDSHRHDYDNDCHHRSESSSVAKPSSAAPPEAPTAPPKATISAAEKKQKSSVFSRIRFPEGDAAASKKRKHSSATAETPASASGGHKGSANGYYEDHPKPSSKKSAAAAAAAVAADYESSDDDRHFKRRPSRYEASPPPVAAEWEEQQPRHSRGSKDRDRDRYSSKHR